ncbi:diguanylate cyclase [Butyrivibrio sp. DSM 10294]|uniref:diguanylate cyclase domain-containing protein n=1 Tax=Butyrivibrio sp. DSM 10294 TaxID=2972457 RepID=UPI00234EB5D8|nr:diguanylate cyclase [Butyrivibrio sp. DSM 10294]MDC7294700.1 diguanylate cyclase [Butyrivibrio sp. DSM 10294]
MFIIIVLLVVIIVRQHKYHLNQIAKFRKMQYHDNLTGVYNYKGFVNRVEELIREHPDIPYMMSFNNIMDFKYINDSQGRNSANELLKFWVDKSLEVMSDVEAIGRLEGDHLALLLRIGGLDKMQKEEQQVFQPVQDFS